MADRLRTTGWSRRRFLRAAATTTAVAGAYAAFSCDKTPTGARPTPAATGTPAILPAASRGGILRAYNFDAIAHDTFDPHLTQMGPIANLHSAIFSRLLSYADERAGTIVPDLAEAMPEQPDDLTYVFRLRTGVRFHDTLRGRAAFPNIAGRELTAEDVKYSLERQIHRNSPQRTRFFRYDQLGVIDEVTARGRHVLHIRLKAPVAPFAAFLAGRHAYIVPREVVDARDEMNSDAAMIGTGPFVLDAFEPQRAVRIRRNRSWFAANDDVDGVGKGRPFIDGYDAYYSPQQDAFQQAAFDRLLVDTTGLEDAAVLDRAHKTNLADIVLEEADGGRILASRFLLDRAPFRDDRARRAVHLAIDRQALALLLYPAMDARPSARMTGPVAPGVTAWGLAEADLLRRPGYRSDPAVRAEDIATARQLWSAAFGETPAPELRVLFHGLPKLLPERAVPFIERQLREALVTPVVPLVDASGSAITAAALLKNLEGATEGVAQFTFGFEDGGVDLDDWVYGQFHSRGSMNTYRLQDATLDGMLEAQRGEFDIEARRAQGIAIQEYLIGNANARVEYVAPVERRLTWGYVRNSHHPLGYGSDHLLANTWLDTSHPAWPRRPA